MASIEVSKIDFGMIIKPLCTRFNFKKMTDDQVDIYYEHLKYQSTQVLVEAVKFLVLEAQHFPTPREFSNACGNVSRQLESQGELKHAVRRSCRSCREGYVKYAYKQHRKDGSSITRYDSRPCGYCNTEPNGLPHYIQIGDKIIMAAKKLPSGMWVPDLKAQEWQQDFSPCYSGDSLAEYFAEEQSGKQTRMNVKNEIVRLKSFTFPAKKPIELSQEKTF